MNETPLVLVHGFLGDADDWSEIVPPLSRDRPCIAVDLPGHGTGPEPPPPSAGAFDAVVRELASRLERQGLSRFDLLGYSMGGRLAFGLVCRFSSRVRRGVAIGASPGLPDEAARAARRGLDESRARQLEEVGLERFLDEWYSQPLFRSLTRSSAFASLLERRRRGNAAALAAMLRALSPARQPYLGDALARTKVPLLLIAGSRDTKYVEGNAALAGSSPRIRAVAVPDAGHSVHIERPAELARIVASFLDETEEGNDG
ncbi:MAG: 2-succinyl-6-hydroxy-2,4-cyclohexadiene-1-carboxylate synthase [Gemmatimonadetes bacterium]|uniref:Putative 2-succinyl-6-hydroxy-2,4-cyclohexadiene-1-carboxylate synthase n=1 Tax=Candidatus Kutchimonas denitrificans TaxID=3056748 RepID=A0AAE4ZA59_9BACT|nr:2-succinyl-6-hydroxy-2,4-cyclohexadiene-1-carboxylate synthase [Gemmatimonadota bacterium]NIR73600.1 2-succinyl-6-hydroxy-2,4-cyclohexadiene-1-carboxylate synthase [Candidatus Kutchimonas denitrificans]NIR99559.1 2-succinyl-6-hydroxy-2,4-cyclohexadiene-1-carboxylate synthase [Gemmatimonadota bacterium]NIT65179.1 2-succinyl-6-hydroxy-2,4-cyclohexadiene-1-carboxylate synthase [Gemmatimonadota bacterium]NIV23712.1 2-succinyl-6-hydroxy-2,4-cyclohexadiene-1-carboxylate synthase [Gemmatimonadota b